MPAIVPYRPLNSPVVSGTGTVNSFGSVVAMSFWVISVDGISGTVVSCSS